MPEMTISNDVMPSAGLKMEQQDSDFLSYYDLDRDPFSDENISGLFFPGAGRAEILESLLHFVRYGDAPVFLTGNAGSGKSATLETLLSQLDSDFDVAVIDAVLMMTPGQMLLSIARELGLSGVQELAPDYGLVSECIVDFIAAQKVFDKRVLICVDNVQDLSFEVFDALFALLTRAEDALSILMVGEGQIQEILTKAATHYHRLLNTIELPSLGDADVESYIRYRMESAGFIGEPPLTDIQLQAIKRRSHGSLDQLNRVAKSMLLAGVDGPAAKTKSFPMPHLLLSVVLLLVIAVALMQGSIFNGAGEHQQTEGELPIVLEGVVSRKRPDPVLDAELDTNSALNGTLNSRSNVSDLPSKAVAETGSELRLQPKDTPGVEEVAAEQPVVASEAVKARVVDVRSRIPASAELASRSNDSEHITELGLVVNETQLDPIPTVNEVKVEEGIADISGGITGESLSNTDRVSVKNELSIADQQDLDDASVKALVDSHEQLMSWPEVGYALQVFGTHNPVRAKQLVVEHSANADLVYYETRHKGQPWYVVVSGPYTGRGMAKEGIQTLPSSLQRLRPWPRNIASIQSDITRYSDAIRVKAEQ